MNIKKVNFKVILNIAAWLFLGLTGVWAIGVFGPLQFELFEGLVLLMFFIMTISSFGLHSYLKEYPENQSKYFIEWLILFVFMVIISFTVFIFG
ncbi:MAG: hypothetical protein EU549_01505 [Promethearchaeota archaeon]|nr:MAG: hypothetical protein EU549_01505 [Candidatus Lokiarchaeota archaeon]